MGKVSIGLRGWRFDEDAVFESDGTYRSLDEMPPDTRDRVVRLAVLVGEPCHACWLIAGDANLSDCTVADVVYGEPEAEVLLCDDHEPDFLYWYREGDGRSHRGDPSLRDAFHEWFADGGRAPAEYAGLDHVDTDPEALPDPPVAGAACDVVIDDDSDGPSEPITDDSSTGDGEPDLRQEYPRPDP